MITDYLIEGYTKTKHREYLIALMQVMSEMEIKEFAS